MNYNYEEWQRIKIKGKTKFIFDFKNFMIIVMFISIFLIVKSVVFRQLYPLKELLFYGMYMIISFSILLIVAQSIKWRLYIKIFKRKLKRVSTIIIKLSEILIGLLNLWVPLGIFYSIFSIAPNSYILKKLSFTLDYIFCFTGYIITNCVFWVLIGIILEFFINASYIKDNNSIYIFISKNIDNI